MRMRDPRIVAIRRVMQRPVCTVPLYKRRLRHARIIKHESPLAPDQIQSPLRLVSEEVSL
jgi:hypothetical protein